MKRFWVIGSLAFAGLLGYALTGLSQQRERGEKPPAEGDRPRGRGDRRPPPPPPQLGKLLPPHIVEALKLSDDQKKKLTELEKETRTKLEKILTADQKKELEKMRRLGPPRGPRGGPREGGPREGGPRGGRPKDDRGPKDDRKKIDD